jgi:ABC-2 type transport system ATP-binding protein
LTGLDPDSIFQVKECMRLHAEKGNAVIFSSHLIDVVENLCTRIVVIKKGHMSRPYTMEEIHKQGSLEQFYMEKTDDLYLKEKEDEEKKLLGAKKS